MILFTGLYSTPNPTRNEELIRCLEKNILCPAITAIRVFWEEGFKPAECLAAILNHSQKITCWPLAGRMTFRAYFDHANVMLPVKELVCVANSDIYFDDTLALLQPRHLDGRFFCLSRWMVQPDGTSHLDKQASCAQDAWIFKTPVKIPPDCDFTTGRPGCDNKLAWLMGEQKYEVLNPSRTVKAHHLHLSRHTNYGPAVPGPHRNVAPCELPA